MTQVPPSGGGAAGSDRRASGRPSRRQGVELDAERIEQLLRRLDARLRDRGVAAVVYVVGGAAVLAATGLRRVTRDVDVAHLDPVVAEEARALAEEEGLPPDWLSAAAGPWAPPDQASRLTDERPGLRVVYASPTELLAMKMIALRTQDAPDIVALSATLGMHGQPAVAFEALLRQVYPDASNLALLLGVPDDDLDQEINAVARAVARLASQKQ